MPIRQLWVPSFSPTKYGLRMQSERKGFIFVVMRIKLLLVILFAFLFCCKGFSQEFDDSLANALVKKHISINNVKITIPGFRIQLFSGNQRTRATEIRAEFILQHPLQPAYLNYQQPNFKVRAGDFKTRLEAQKFLSDIQDEYPVAFIVKDEVKLPEIK